MMNQLFLGLAVISVMLISLHGQNTNKFRMSYRSSFSRGEKAEPGHQHHITIAVKQYNVNILHDMLAERSTPGSPYYQKWLTEEEIANLTYDQNAVSHVTEWLAQNNVTITSKSKNSEYIYARASIHTWERMLNTTFNVWHDSQDPENVKTYHRADNYTIPSSMTPYIYSMFKTCQAPPVIRSEIKSIGHRQLGLTPVNIAFLNNLYGISSNLVPNTMNQAVGATFTGVKQTFNPNDLSMYQSANGITSQAAFPIGVNTTTTCNNDCGEGNLDVQTLMGMSQGAKTTYYYSDGSISDPFIEILTQIEALPVNQRPTVLSISYGGSENSYPADLMNTFNTEALKLVSQGLTILVSSGDDGASGFPGQCNTVSSSSATQWKGTNTWTGTGYMPSYPAASPYVTAVGATMGPERGNPEIVSQTCSSTSATTAGVFNGITPITSGGGFSSYNPTPTWQQSAVTAYLNANPTLASGFNPKGRGFPDLSFIGVYYHIYVNGVVKQVYGTSASAPLAAGIINLINARRLAGGYNTTVGFINPTLYANPGAFNDITSGSNYCASYQGGSTPITCCNAGFKAGPGWDPVTGLGSITYWNLMSILAPNVPTPAPTAMPTIAPTFVPTIAPTRSPTAKPSAKPTFSPTFKPTNVPTIAPTKSPTSRPSTRTPTIKPTPKPTSKPTIRPTYAPTNYAQGILYKCGSQPVLSTSSTQTLWWATVNFTQFIYNATVSDLDNITGIPSFDNSVSCAMHTSNFNNVINTVNLQFYEGHDASFRRLTSLQQQQPAESGVRAYDYSARSNDAFHPDLFIQAPTPTISVSYNVMFQFLVDNTADPTAVMNTQATNLNTLLNTNIDNGNMMAVLRQICSTSGGCFNSVSNFSHPAMSTPVLIPQTIVAGKGKYNIGLIIGASFGAVCGILIIVVLVMTFYRHKDTVFETFSSRSGNSVMAGSGGGGGGGARALAQYGSENNSAFDSTSDRPDMIATTATGEHHRGSMRDIDVDQVLIDSPHDNENNSAKISLFTHIMGGSTGGTSPSRSPIKPTTIYYIDDSLKNNEDNDDGFNNNTTTTNTQQMGIIDPMEVQQRMHSMNQSVGGSGNCGGVGGNSYYDTGGDDDNDDGTNDGDLSEKRMTSSYSPRPMADDNRPDEVEEDVLKQHTTTNNTTTTTTTTIKQKQQNVLRVSSDYSQYDDIDDTTTNRSDQDGGYRNF